MKQKQGEESMFCQITHNASRGEYTMCLTQLSFKEKLVSLATREIQVGEVEHPVDITVAQSSSLA